MRIKRGQKLKLVKMLLVPLYALKDKWEGIFVIVTLTVPGTLLLSILVVDSIFFYLF